MNGKEEHPEVRPLESELRKALLSLWRFASGYSMRLNDTFLRICSRMLFFLAWLALIGAVADAIAFPLVFGRDMQALAKWPVSWLVVKTITDVLKILSFAFLFLLLSQAILWALEVRKYLKDLVEFEEEDEGEAPQEQD